MEDKKILSKPVPKLGRDYICYDDGKRTACRMFVGKVTRLVGWEESDGVIVKARKEDPDFSNTIDENGGLIYIDRELKDLWRENLYYSCGIYSTKTDYFVEVTAPEFDEFPLWFVRTQSGDWFSLDIQNDWQGSRLDLDGSITRKVDREQFRKYYQPRCFLNNLVRLLLRILLVVTYPVYFSIILAAFLLVTGMVPICWLVINLYNYITYIWKEKLVCINMDNCFNFLADHVDWIPEFDKFSEWISKIDL